jgi:hypothetical protein
MATTGCEAILVQYIAFTLTYCGQIAEMATRHRLSSAYEVREYVDAGGLISGATLSDAVVAAAETHYGHAGRAFLEKLTRDKHDWQAYCDAFKEFIVGGADGQVTRAASKFGLVAMAGELAIE